MKPNNRRLSTVLLVVYIICTILMIYLTFDLSNNLVQNGLINLGDLDHAESIFSKQTLFMIAYGILGIGTIYYLMSNGNISLVYVDKKEEKKNNDDLDLDDDLSDIDTSTIKKVLSSQSKDIDNVTDQILQTLCKTLNAGMGAFYKAALDGETSVLNMTHTYAMMLGESEKLTFEFGQGLVGQAANEKRTLVIDDIPEGYINIVSGLGSSSPTHLLIAPIEGKDQLFGVLEIASFEPFSNAQKDLVDKTLKKLSEKIVGKRKKEKTEDDPKKDKKN